MQVQFTEADIQAKAVELGVIEEDQELPRSKRSRVVAAMLQQAAAGGGHGQAEPKLAAEIVIQPGGVILVDGEPFPWLVANQPMEIGLDPDGISTVRMTLMASTVQIIKPEPQESE
ncbi:hypothetical protein [Streptomyces sp. NPDC059176]|uniref:hypothetical protein n=1 Tax=Streptomyces sp. NPDC059176 TaxID=3346758 RepID=UPI0036C547AF